MSGIQVPMNMNDDLLDSLIAMMSQFVVRSYYMTKKKRFLPAHLTTVTNFSKFLAVVLFIFFPLVAFLLGTVYGTQIAQINMDDVPRVAPEPRIEVVPEPAELIPTAIPKPTASPISKNENTSRPLSFEGVAYLLPEGWVANEDSWRLRLTPKTGGGYLNLEVYSYPKNVGRREYYCQVSGVCIEGTTYFTETTIGNISGYTASAIDASGGGTEYFGAKGDKFYRILTYNPPSPNEFEKGYKQVLSSFEF